jgi:hypothetical protein
MGIHIPEDGICHSHRREDLRSYFNESRQMAQLIGYLEGEAGKDLQSVSELNAVRAKPRHVPQHQRSAPEIVGRISAVAERFNRTCNVGQTNDEP